MIKKKENIEIGKRIHIARERMGLTQEVLAEKLDLSTQYISDVERGASGISVPTLMGLCEILKISSDYILFGITESDEVKASIRMVSYMSKDEQRLINNAINNTIEAINLHNE